MARPSQHALIIEDDMVTGMDMQFVLTGFGFDSFAFASTASQAREQARLRKPDLVTADIVLLDGDGRDACRAVEAECGPVPIIYVTGLGERLATCDGLAVVAKPFGPAAIARAFHAVTHRSSAD